MAKVTVNVPTTGGRVVHDGASDFSVADGHLIVTTSSKGRIAVYAPGSWTSATVNTD